MRILATFPGRSGDLLWAMPSVRALAETYSQPIELMVSQKYGSLAPLLQRQAYIDQVIVNPDWLVEESAPMQPRVPPNANQHLYDQVFHLGYEGWPEVSLPSDIYGRAVRQAGSLHPLGDWHRPWIKAPYGTELSCDITVGFTDEHFELKYGIWWLLRNRFSEKSVVFVGNSPRWAKEAGWGYSDWEAAAAYIANSQVFVGCCSALHVLAVAIGTPAVVLEPAAARLASVFWPCGFDGPQVQVVRGGDGLPTVDSRHLGDLVEAAMKVRSTC